MHKKLPSLSFLIIAVLAALILTFLTNGWIFCAGRFKLENWYSKLFDPAISIGTFVFALLIWKNEREQVRVDNLPKKLTVHFKLGEYYIMSCYEAHLGGEGDIRAMAQQIGTQMGRQPYLSFYPYVTTKPYPFEKVRKEENDRIILYTVTIHLKEMPTGNPLLQENYLFWTENDDTNLGNKEGIVPNHPCKPLDKEDADKIAVLISSNSDKLSILKDLIKALDEKIKILEQNALDASAEKEKRGQYIKELDRIEIPRLETLIIRLEKKLTSND